MTVGFVSIDRIVWYRSVVWYGSIVWYRSDRLVSVVSIEDEKTESIDHSYRSVGRSIRSTDRSMTDGRTDGPRCIDRLDSTRSIDRIDPIHRSNRPDPTETTEVRVKMHACRAARTARDRVVVASRRRARTRRGGAMTVVKRTNRCATVAFGCDRSTRETNERTTRMQRCIWIGTDFQRARERRGKDAGRR